ncbi:MAG TPA: hypothetical protein VKD90_25945 [Gemmataceae bacterium]|nr:hypothetical protein [Gemmataceae bacterium]
MRLSPALLALLVAAPALAADLTKIDRSLKKEPVYQSKSPKYGLLVFGPKAETRVWLVLDLGEPWDNDSAKNTLYVDRNGDGDLTGPDERVVCTLKKQELIASFSPEPSVTYSPVFDVGDIVEHDGKTRHTKLTVRVDSYIQRYRPVFLEVNVAGRGEQFAGGQLLAFADRPQDAPAIHFGGPLTLRLSMETGILHVPINYDDKPEPGWYDKHPPKYEERSLVRGEARMLVAQIGTPGLGRGTFAALSAGVPPAGLHPAAAIEFPPADPKEKSVRVSARLDSRCCGTLFRGAVTVPDGAAEGQAKVSLSFADWKEGKVVPATGEVAVTKPVRPAGKDGTKE